MRTKSLQVDTKRFVIMRTRVKRKCSLFAPQYNTKNKPFVLRRQDLDVTVLPTKYIEELRTIPNAKLSRGKANFMVFHADNTLCL